MQSTVHEFCGGGAWSAGARFCAAASRERVKVVGEQERHSILANGHHPRLALRIHAREDGGRRVGVAGADCDVDATGLATGAGAVRRCASAVSTAVASAVRRSKKATILFSTVDRV